MRRPTLVIATLLTALLAGAGAAQAKGVMGGASINGPGAGGPGGGGINFDARDASDDGFWTLLEETGLIAAVDGAGGYELSGPPPSADALGPRYTLAWSLEQFEGPDVEFVQYLYPYAGDQSWIFTPRDVNLQSGDVPAGWHQTGSNALRFHLERYGLPRVNPEAATAGRAAQAAAEAESASSYLPFLLVAGLIALIVIASRKLPRAAQTTT